MGHETGGYYPQALSVMAEKHPPSPVLEGVPIASEIAGQARNDGKGLRTMAIAPILYRFCGCKGTAFFDTE